MFRNLSRFFDWMDSNELLNKLNEIIKTAKSKILGRDIVISDVQLALYKMYMEHYSEEKLKQYQSVIEELTKKKETSKLDKKEITKLNNHIQYLREQEYTKEMLDILKQEHISKGDAVKILLPFADPTLDASFKMLFGQDENSDILISLLNSLLDFKGKDLIEEVKINPNELVVSNISYKKGDTGISSAVDILCTTNDGRQIAIEIQGQKTNYFLTREQEYMAKLIYGQVKEGQGHEYHVKVLDTYILVIGKENMFVGNTALKGKVLNNTKLDSQELFEIDVEPRIKQTGEVVPGNKMHWKFFELPKFRVSAEYKKIKGYDLVIDNSNKKLYQEKIEWLNNNLKEQWLEFLIECSNQITIPDRNKLIKKGYEIMKLVTWDSVDRALLWKQKQNEIDAMQQKEFDKEEAFHQGELKGIKIGKLEGLKEGKLKMLLKQDIQKLQKHFKRKDEEELDKNETFLSKKRYLKQLDKEQKWGATSVEEKFEFITKHIKTHLDDKYDKISNDLGLEGNSMDLENISDCDEWSSI
ncbi:uncharacterized protein LOC124816417 isoform X1 [Hydra vulgaris]|uniref:uncharacterized protein LOC124816417 isoform X1 n=1 Tax=Hydra vulgaris TaxID=6087 RepID=UPI001F5F72C3|nr:uncharacterized protein LOC124816417 isoform X2 [Hydra vulgaris]